MDLPQKPETDLDLTAPPSIRHDNQNTSPFVRNIGERTESWIDDVQSPLPVHREPGVLPGSLIDRSSPDSTRVRRDEGTPEGNLRRHVLRAALRIATLLATDLAAFGVVLASMRIIGLDWVRTSATSGVGYLLNPEGVKPFILALAVGLAASGSYGFGDKRRDGGRIFVGCALAACIFSWRQLWESPQLVGLELLLLVVTLGSVLVVARYVLDRLIRRRRARTRIAARAVLVGSPADCVRVYTEHLVNENDFMVLGFVDASNGPATPEALGRERDLDSLLRDNGADTVILCGSPGASCIERVVRAATVEGCELLAVTHAFDVPGVRPAIVWRRGRPLLELRTEARRGQELLVKRVFDIVASSILLVLLSPLLAAAAIAIRLESPGPIIFGHLRAGKHGNFFRCLKFRSMYPDAEARLHSDPQLYEQYLQNDFKLPPDADPRITRTGRFLRR
ncbi:MAG TPA: sugar transferase, partial [Gemmatimonadales bacterium]|nr:sugar transferase [Gemmatimonadales bacterium]